MDNIVLISENCRISYPHRLMLNISDQKDVRRCGKYVVLSNLSIYYTWNNITNSCKNNNFKTSAPMWHDKLDLLEESYSASDIQDFF